MKVVVAGAGATALEVYHHHTFCILSSFSSLAKVALAFTFVGLC